MNMNWSKKLFFGYGYDLLTLLFNVLCDSDHLGLQFDNRGFWQ